MAAMTEPTTAPDRGALIRRFAVVVAVIAAPIALAVASQTLAAEPGPPPVSGDPVQVELAPAEASSAGTSPSPEDSAGPDRGVSDSTPDRVRPADRTEDDDDD